MKDLRLSSLSLRIRSTIQSPFRQSCLPLMSEESLRRDAAESLEGLSASEVVDSLVDDLKSKKRRIMLQSM